MPLVLPDPTITTFPVIQIEGLPDFNEEDQDTFVTEDMEGWLSFPPPRTSLSPNGGGAGAVPSGDWLASEDYQTFSGWVLAPPAEQEYWRQALLTCLPATRGVTIKMLGRGWDVDKQIFDVRRYDRPTFEKRRDRIKFAIPLVLPDPLKYGLNPKTGSVGVDVGGVWYRPYSKPGSEHVRTYTKAGAGDYRRTYTLPTATTTYPTVLALTSEGSHTSKRVTVTVNGPVTASDWYLLQNDTRRLWVPISLAAGTTLTIDCYRRRVSFNGVYDRTLTGKLLGVPFTLEPGGNTYKLVTGALSSAPYATVSAYEAYQ